jgi:hypothetical protein
VDLLSLTGFLSLLLCECCRSASDAGGSASSSYRWERQGESNVLFCGEELAGTLAPGGSAGVKCKDHITALESGVFRIRRAWTNTSGSRIDGARLTIDFVSPFRAQYAMIPSVLYNGNAWGQGGEPKGWKRDGRWWSFSSTRTPIPGATFVQNERFSTALWAEPGHGRLSCSLMPEDDAATQRLIWPEEEEPAAYSNRDHFEPGWAKSLSLAPGKTFSVSVILVVDASKESAVRSTSRFLDVAWRHLKKQIRSAHTPSEIWRYRIQFAKESLWAEEGEFRGFSIGLLPEGDGWKQRSSGKYEIGWCGQNGSLANSLLADFLMSRDADSLNRGLAALDCWEQGAALPNGLFAVQYDDILARRDRFTIDACNLGTAALNFFEAHELARKCGVQRPGYRSVALAICDFAVRAQEGSGRFGKAWDNRGECVDRDGTIGEWLVLPLIEAYEIDRDAKYLESARRGHELYFGEFQRNGFSSAGALDTTCIDKESAIALLRGALGLYRATGDRAYLDQAEEISTYLSTWLWHYSTEFPPDSELRRLRWDTFGCTSVSAQHHHLDAYAVYWVADWLQLAELTGHPIWKEKAIAIWRNSLQIVSDGSLMVNGRLRPAGSINEAFFETYWGGEFGHPNDWLVAWPAAFQLETLRHLLPDWSALAGASGGK